MKKQRHETVVDLDWWKEMPTKTGLPKGHPFLDRENRKEGHGGKKIMVKEQESESKK